MKNPLHNSFYFIFEWRSIFTKTISLFSKTIIIIISIAFARTIIIASKPLACTKPYYFDVADDSRVCYVEKDFLSEVICKKLHVEEQCLNYDF